VGAIEGLFQANKESRTIFLSHEFHSMTQGDLSISEYCQRLKTASDSLRDVGPPIFESQLMLNLLCSLIKRYSNAADNIADRPNLTFATARNSLVFKELRLANEEKVTASTALFAFGSSTTTCTSTSCRGSSSTGSGGFGG